MNAWDEQNQRWKTEYRGKTLVVSAKALGGSGRSDTESAAAEWFKKEKQRIDKELSPNTEEK